MKHAKKFLRKHNATEDDKYIDETNDEELATVIQETHNNKLKCIICNIIIFVILGFIFFNNIRQYNHLSSTVYYMIIFIFILMSLSMFLSINYLLLNKNYRLEKLFLIIMIPTSIIYSTIIVPGMVPDEGTHMKLTYSLASQIMGVEKESITLRAEEKYIYDHMPAVPTMENYEYNYSHLLSKEDNNKYIAINESTSNWKLVFGYFPAVIGVVLSRLLHFGATPTLYVARLFNLVFYVWITYFAIKKTPIGKQLMFMISILPMCSQQMMSLSYDAVLNAATFFCIGYGLYFVYENDKVKYDEYLKYLMSVVLLLSIKSAIYAFLLLIPLLAKFKNHKGVNYEKKQKIVLFLCCGIFILLLYFVSFGAAQSKESVEIAQMSKHIISWSGTEGYTIQWLILHPLKTIILFWNTLELKFIWYWYSCLGQYLGCFSITLPENIFKIWGMLLVLSSLREETEEIELSKKILFIIISLIIFFLVMLSMCIYWTPLGYEWIEGVQGRYYIPILFTVFIVLNNKHIKIKENVFRYINIFSSLVVSYTILALLNVCY